MSEARHMVMRCTECGMLNVVPRDRFGCRCADCDGAMMPVGYAILQEDASRAFTVSVGIERDQLDRLIEDVQMLSDHVDNIVDKMDRLKQEADDGETL